MAKAKKNKEKLSSNKFIFSSKSLRSVLNNYKKNQEKKKIKEIKLKKLAENTQIIKDRKELRSWEEKLTKESNKLKIKEEELKLKEKELKIKEEQQKVENKRLIKKDEDLGLIDKDLRLKEKELKLKGDEQFRKDIDIKALAYAGLHYSQYNNPQIKQFLVSEVKSLNGSEEAVRRRWGLILDYFGSVYFLSGDREKAKICYELASEVLPDDETISSNLKRVQS